MKKYYLLLLILCVINLLPYVAITLLVNSGPNNFNLFVFVAFWSIWYIFGGLLTGTSLPQLKWWHLLIVIIVPATLFTLYLSNIKYFLVGGIDTLGNFIVFNSVLYLPSAFAGKKISHKLKPVVLYRLSIALLSFVVVFTAYTFTSLGLKTIQHRNALKLSDTKAITIAKTTPQAQIFISKFPNCKIDVDRSGRFAVDFSADSKSNAKGFIILRLFIDDSRISEMYLSDQSDDKYQGLIWNREEIIDTLKKK